MATIHAQAIRGIHQINFKTPETRLTEGILQFLKVRENSDMTLSLREQADITTSG